MSANEDRQVFSFSALNEDKPGNKAGRECSLWTHTRGCRKIIFWPSSFSLHKHVAICYLMLHEFACDTKYIHTVCVHSSLCFLVYMTFRNDIIAGNLLQKHFWFTCRSFEARQYFSAHIFCVCDCSHSPWLRLPDLCCSSGEMPPPGSLNRAWNKHSNLHTLGSDNDHSMMLF